jgi:hypothetical protein
LSSCTTPATIWPSDASFSGLDHVRLQALEVARRAVHAPEALARGERAREHQRGALGDLQIERRSSRCEPTWNVEASSSGSTRSSRSIGNKRVGSRCIASERPGAAAR